MYFILFWLIGPKFRPNVLRSTLCGSVLVVNGWFSYDKDANKGCDWELNCFWMRVTCGQMFTDSSLVSQIYGLAFISVTFKRV